MVFFFLLFHIFFKEGDRFEFHIEVFLTDFLTLQLRLLSGPGCMLLNLTQFTSKSCLADSASSTISIQKPYCELIACIQSSKSPTCYYLTSIVMLFYSSQSVSQSIPTAASSDSPTNVPLYLPATYPTTLQLSRTFSTSSVKFLPFWQLSSVTWRQSGWGNSYSQQQVQFNCTHKPTAISTAANNHLVIIKYILPHHARSPTFPASQINMQPYCNTKRGQSRAYNSQPEPNTQPQLNRDRLCVRKQLASSISWITKMPASLKWANLSTLTTQKSNCFSLATGLTAKVRATSKLLMRVFTICSSQLYQSSTPNVSLSLMVTLTPAVALQVPSIDWSAQYFSARVGMISQRSPAKNWNDRDYQFRWFS